ncbi:MAG TPA: NAD(P)H-hydrate dehydratase [Thermomicrobiales bacterium]|nr:NAD(P)H-hydrate dehydratase [Thermomicrobiales bacterium]
MTIPVPQVFSLNDIRPLIPRRSAGAHKWSVGSVMLIAGSPGYIGAPALAAMSASRSGAGIVDLVTASRIANTIAGLVPETVLISLPDGEIGNGKRLLSTIGERAGRAHAFLLGPGIGTDDYAADLVRVLLGLSQNPGNRSLGFGDTNAATANAADERNLIDFVRPIVVDADALTLLSAVPEWWKMVPADRLVLTPHAGELSRLTGQQADDIAADPATAAHNAAVKFHQTIVLKGAPTTVATADSVWQASDAPTALATAGTGDVLSGSIAAFLAQGLAPVAATKAAVAVGIAATRFLEPEVGVLGLVASDLPRAIARILAETES